MGIGKILLQTAAGVLATSAIACFMKSARSNSSIPADVSEPKPAAKKNANKLKAKSTGSSTGEKTS